MIRLKVQIHAKRRGTNQQEHVLENITWMPVGTEEAFYDNPKTIVSHEV